MATSSVSSPAAVRSRLAAQLGVCVLYGGSSVALSMTNKALLSSYGFDGYFTMLAAQLVLALTVCVVSRDTLGNPLSVPRYADVRLAEAAPLAAAYVLNIGVGLAALALVPVPLFFCLRRLVAPMILLYEFAVLGKVASLGVRGAVSLIVVGTLLAGADTLRAGLLGYALTLVNNVLSAAASVMQKQLADRRGLSVFGVMYVTALLAAPAAALLAVVTGELGRAAAFAHIGSPVFWAGFWATAVMGIVLTYASILSTTYNSPLATSITGNVKDIATTAIGWVAFPGFSPTSTAVGGIAISFVGAFAYSAVTVRAQWAAAAAKAAGDDGAAAPPAAAAADAEAEAAQLKAAAAKAAAAATSAPAAAAAADVEAGLPLPAADTAADGGSALRDR